MEIPERGERNRFQIMQPQFEILHDPTAGEGSEEHKWQSLEVGRVVPIYESAGKDG